ncbi:MAG: LamG-like jellyroll fold domain-containing protein [Planctomycetia bacterium]|nr:LamG-like jellyroll fold domain-containing protein [Planctomycetia bacterium]
MFDENRHTEELQPSEVRLPPKEQVWDLIGRYVQGSLTPEEGKELLHLLETVPSWRTVLRENLMADFLLHHQYSIMRQQDELIEINHDLFEAIKDAPFETRPIIILPRESRSFRNRWRTIWKRVTGNYGRHGTGPIANEKRFILQSGLFLLVFSLIGVACWIIYLGSKETHENDWRSDSTARVTEVISPVWENNTEEYRRGQLINEGELSLVKGLVQLEMNNGTTLIMTGPSQISLHDAMKVSCKFGKLSVNVSKAATGYEIVTPFGNIVDRGTEFFTHVAKRDTCVDVVKGKVDVFFSSREFIPLSDRQTLRFNHSSTQRKIEKTRSTEYIRSKTVSEIAQEQTKIYLKAKTVSDLAINVDENLLLRLDFTGNDFHSLENCAGTTGVKPMFLGGTRIEGELCDTHAILFHTLKDGVAVDLPEKYKKLTLVTRIQIDKPVNRTNVLYASNNLLESTGGILWQITQNGELQVQISQRPGGALQSYTSAPCLKTLRRGSWVELAVVFDTQNKRITQYVDGRAAGWSTGGTNINWKSISSLVPGSCTIGNIAQSATSPDLRALTFPMSEFRIYKTALHGADLKKNSRPSMESLIPQREEVVGFD